MPRAKAKGMRLRAQQRISDYVYDRWPNTREAARMLKVPHNTLWRSMTGNNANGPSLVIVTALADHSGKSTDYFLGREE